MLLLVAVATAAAAVMVWDEVSPRELERVKGEGVVKERGFSSHLCFVHTFTLFIQLPATNTRKNKAQTTLLRAIAT